LRPDFIKLDRALVTGLAGDPARRALVSALVEFADQMDAVVIGEGVERSSELRALTDLGVHAMQGYLFARPSTNSADWHDWALGFMNHRHAAQEDSKSAVRASREEFS
jgi:EAL domain-containing protein (putative c-di-GMP-specific phosphodiesterase class I)